MAGILLYFMQFRDGIEWFLTSMWDYNYRNEEDTLLRNGERVKDNMTSASGFRVHYWERGKCFFALYNAWKVCKLTIRTSVQIVCQHMSVALPILLQAVPQK